MPFSPATVTTNRGKAIAADRVRATPATYTSSPRFIAIGDGATGAARTASAGDTTLTHEVETRTAGVESTVTTTVTGDTYQVVGSITASISRSIDEGGSFDSGTSNAGNMFVSFTQNVDNLNPADSLQITIKWQLI